MQSFYVDTTACAQAGVDVRWWFPVNVGLRQWYVMSLWLFNACKSKDGWLREVNARVLGKWLELFSVNGGRFEITHLLFADDTALVADSEEKLFPNLFDRESSPP